MNTLEWLSCLISFDTTSRNSNLALIANVKDFLTEKDIQSRLTYNEDHKKANLFATIPAHDGTTSGGLILSGHTDVVPVDGQDWATNPFEMVQVSDRVFGRGTSDMKGFIAVALALIPEFQKLALQKPLHLALSYDEEVGCHGASFMIADLVQAGISANACIVGEPSSMRPVIAHKGIQLFHCRVHGRAAHSSLTPQGCNAIDYAAEVISYIRSLAAEIKRQGPFDKAYDVPYTTISTNWIRGGAADNIIPELCEFVFEFRHLPQVSPVTIIEKIKRQVQEIILPTMQLEKRDAMIEIAAGGAVPSFEGDLKGAIYQLAQEICEEKEKVKVAYATEAGLFQNAGIPTIVCGPGSIEQAHRPNEFVALEQLKICEKFLLNVVKKFLK